MLLPADSVMSQLTWLHRHKTNKRQTQKILRLRIEYSQVSFNFSHAPSDVPPRLTRSWRRFLTTDVWITGILVYAVTGNSRQRFSADELLGAEACAGDNHHQRLLQRLLLPPPAAAVNRSSIKLNGHTAADKQEMFHRKNSFTLAVRTAQLRKCVRVRDQTGRWVPPQLYDIAYSLLLTASEQRWL